MSELTEETPTRRASILSEENYLDFQLDSIKGFVPQRPLQRNWSRDHLTKNQVTLSPTIIWVDEMVGTTTTRYAGYMRWQKPPAIRWVDEMMGTTFTWYAMGRQVDNSHPLCHGYMIWRPIVGDAPPPPQSYQGYSWIFGINHHHQPWDCMVPEKAA